MLPVSQHLNTAVSSTGPSSTIVTSAFNTITTNTTATYSDSTGSKSRNKSNGRQNLAQWMETQLHSGQFPGVEWVDESKRIFCIPWKHHRRDDWTESDGLIYKQWAIHKGRFTEGTDKPDWNQWKLNLRCALNKRKDIQQLKDMDTDSCKFYRFECLTDCSSASPTHQNSSPSPPVGSSKIPHSSHQLPLCPSIEGNIPTFIHVSPKMEEPTAEECYEDPVGSLSSDLQLISIEDDMKELVVGTVIPVKDISMDSNINSIPESIELRPEMILMLRYDRELVLRHTVSNPQGCRVFHGDLMPLDKWNSELFGSYHADQLQIPDRPGRSMELQFSEKDLRQSKVLSALEQGINICMHEGNIYIQRKCKASVYIKIAHLDGSQTYKVDRDIIVRIFDFEGYFLPAFERYRQNKGPPPSPLAVISFGQNFHKYEEPYTNLFLSLTVCHAQAEKLLSECVRETTTVEISDLSECLYLESMKTDSFKHEEPLLESMKSDSFKHEDPLLESMKSDSWR